MAQGDELHLVRNIWALLGLIVNQGRLCVSSLGLEVSPPDWATQMIVWLPDLDFSLMSCWAVITEAGTKDEFPVGASNFVDKFYWAKLNKHHESDHFMPSPILVERFCDPWIRRPKIVGLVPTRTAEWASDHTRSKQKAARGIDGIAPDPT